MKKTVSLILIIAVLFSGIVLATPATNAFSASDCPKKADDGWYTVYTAKEFEYSLYNLSDKQIRLMKDITFKSDDFTDVGAYPKGFLNFDKNTEIKGVFDGCGHSVKNATMHTFCASNNGTIKNLTFENCVFSASSCAFSQNNSGVIENCRLIYSTADCFVENNKESGTIRNCTLDDGVNSAKKNPGSYNCTVNDNSGLIDGFVNYANNCAVRSNYEGATVKNYINFGKNEAQGICAINHSGGTITACANYGEISANASKAYGIVGSNLGLLTNCINYGKITADSYNVYGIGDNAQYCINLGELYSTETCYKIGENPDGCYYFDENSTEPCALNSESVALESSYPELDFISIWEIRDGKVHLKTDKERTVAVTPYTYPAKTSYYQYEEIDFSDMIFMVCDNYGEWKTCTDFTVDNSTQELGKVSVTVKCKDLYFEIPVNVWKNIEKASVELSHINYVYDGSAKTPAISVKGEGTETLSPDSDYKLTYSNNVNAGNAVVKIEGKGLYRGSISVNYKIAPCPLKSESIRLNTTSYWYNAKAKTPAAVVKRLGRVLKRNSDYTVSYTNNTNPGTATATIKGKGNFSGTFNRKFKIKILKVTGVASYKTTNKSIPLKWKALTAMSGYEIQLYNAKTKKWTTKVRTAKNHAIVSKLATGKRYAFRVRAYKQVGNKKHYGAYSAVFFEIADFKPVYIKKARSGRLVCYTTAHFSTTKDLSVEKTKKSGRKLSFYRGKKFKVLGKDKNGGDYFYVLLKYNNKYYYGYIKRYNACVENGQYYVKKSEKKYNSYYKSTSKYNYCIYNDMPFYQFNQTGKYGKINGLYISNSCGPYALAAALSALKGSIVFPEQIMGAMSSSVTNSGGKGSNITGLARSVTPYMRDTQNLGFEYKKILPHQSFAYLKKGYMVILGVENRDGLQLFTSGSHYIVLAGYDEMGNVITVNSNLKTRLMDSFSVGRINRNIKNSWFYRENTIAIKYQYDDKYTPYAAIKKGVVKKAGLISEHADSMGELRKVKVGKNLNILGVYGNYYYISFMSGGENAVGYIDKKIVKI